MAHEEWPLSERAALKGTGLLKVERITIEQKDASLLGSDLSRVLGIRGLDQELCRDHGEYYLQRPDAGRRDCNECLPELAQFRSA
jgi:hypothetical protein